MSGSSLDIIFNDALEVVNIFSYILTIIPVLPRYKLQNGKVSSFNI